MKLKTSLTRDRLLELLNYQPETGQFTWRVSRGTKKAGSAAGCNNKGYVEISIDGETYKAHRLAWLYVHGTWPESEIDHRYGVRSDNRIMEIREATHAQNMRNRGAYSRNKSGYSGVDWRPDKAKWRARIGINGKQVNIGHFDSAEAAHAARVEAMLRLNDEFRRVTPADAPRIP